MGCPSSLCIWQRGIRLAKFGHGRGGPGWRKEAERSVLDILNLFMSWELLAGPDLRLGPLLEEVAIS